MQIDRASKLACRKPHGALIDYVAIARPDHWVKHIFIVPGLIAAVMLVPSVDGARVGINILFGFASACLIASANYVINEWLDASYDLHHPTKAERPAAAGRLNPTWIYTEYACLATLGIALAYQVGSLFAITAVVFLLSGVVYNVPPFRLKDRAYFDVLAEAINNPIRLILGWSIVSSVTVPPLSLVGSFWMAGAFLMAAKRLSEFRFIVERRGLGAAGNYRRSFQTYTTEILTLSCFFYGVLASFLIAVFLIKYRAEYILSFPLVAVLFGYYFHLGLQPVSGAQHPEKLYRDRHLIAVVIGLVALLIILSVFDLPSIERLVQSTFLEIRLE